MMTNINVCIIFLGFVGYTLSFPVRTGGTLQLFYCKRPGCAADVKRVFCDDDLIFESSNITHCSGPPPENTTCQHDGHAYVSFFHSPHLQKGGCQFEGQVAITTEQCKDLDPMCDFTSATMLTPDTSNDEENVGEQLKPGEIALIVVGGAMGLSGAILLAIQRKRKKQNADQSQQHDREDLMLNNSHSSGVTERDTHPGNGLKRPLNSNVMHAQDGD